MLRCFDNGNITHVDGSIDPVRDKGIIDTELQLKDLETVESRLAKTQKQATSGGDKNAKRTVELLLQYKAVLEQGRSARTVELDKEDRKLVADLNLLTDKPVLYVCNVDERSAATGNAYTEAVRAAIADERAEMLVDRRSDRSRHRRTGRVRRATDVPRRDRACRSRAWRA